MGLLSSVQGESLAKGAFGKIRLGEFVSYVDSSYLIPNDFQNFYHLKWLLKVILNVTVEWNEKDKHLKRDQLLWDSLQLQNIHIVSVRDTIPTRWLLCISKQKIDR